jgi:VanZ family protein
MKIIFLFLTAIVVFLFLLAVVFKPGKHRKVLWIVSALILLVTFYFGLKPKGYRFINGAHWLKQGNGIVFTNTGMIYSEKPLGTIGITDSVVLFAEFKPYWNYGFARFITIVDKNNEECVSVDQFRLGSILSIRMNDSNLSQVYLPNTATEDSLRKIALGISGGNVWLQSDNTKIAVKKLPPDLQPHFLENGTLLIGYNPSGKNGWRGELHRLVIAKSCSNLPFKNNSVTKATDSVFFDTQSCEPVAEFSFAKTSDRHIENKYSGSWNMYMPLFPKIFTYELPEPLTDAFTRSNYNNRYRLRDPVVNFLGFIPLGAIMLLLFLSSHKSTVRAFIMTFLVSLLTSTIIELTQIFIPTRVSQLIDIVLNVTGACAGAVAILFLSWIFSFRRQVK